MRLTKVIIWLKNLQINIVSDFLIKLLVNKKSLNSFAIKLKINNNQLKLKVKDIFEIAKKELSELSTVANPDFRLEQVQYDEKHNQWEVVVSYLVENTNKRTNSLGIPISEFQFYRIYKKLIIDSEKKCNRTFYF